MQNSPYTNMPSDKESGFFKKIGQVTAVLGIIGLGFGGGVYYQTNKIDIDKRRLESSNLDLLDSLERTRESLRNDSVSMNNFIRQNTNGFLFNTHADDLPLLTVSNANTNPCIEGQVDGCWKHNTKAKIGDIVGIQFHCNNAGGMEVLNAIFGYRLEYTNSGKTIVCRGGIAVGNTIAKSGVAHIFLKEPGKLTYISRNQRLIRFERDTGEIVKEDTLFGERAFKIGTIPFKGERVLVIQFRVDKAD